jgi:hypothetical protein
MAGSNGIASAGPTYDWEIAFREDPRMHALQAAIDRILVTSFPAVAAKLQKAEPPATRQESALPSSFAAAVKPERMSASHMWSYPFLMYNNTVVSYGVTASESVREELDVTTYMTESSSDADSQTEIDPKEALREMEARAAQSESAGDKSHDVAMADADADNGFEPADEDASDDVEQPTACAACHQADNEKQILLCDGCDDGTASSFSDFGCRVD